MRKAMFDTVEAIVRTEENAVLLLADIGAMGFSKLLQDIPERAMNIGIFEAGMVGVAAGMALKGMNPILYGITPFIAERAFEQLKLDFAYQKLGATFITTGASYDFSTLGYSHFCYEDIALIKQLSEVEFVAPGTSNQMRSLLSETYNNGKPTFIRMSDYPNKIDCPVTFGKATVIKEGTKATIIAVSTMLDAVMEACGNEDVTILYYTTLVPFDAETLRKYCRDAKVLLCEPHVSGALLDDVINAVSPQPIHIEMVGVPRKIIRNYGKKEEKDIALGLTSQNIRKKLGELINI